MSDDAANNGQVRGDVAANGDDAEHPAGRIRVSRANVIGMRAGALAGFAMASMAVAGVFAHLDTTSSLV